MTTIAIAPSIAAYLGAPSELPIEVGSVAEAIDALKCNFPAWAEVVKRLTSAGVGFVVRVGHTIITEDQIGWPIPAKVERIVIDVIPSGAGGNKTFGIIAGIALIGLSLFSGGIGFLGMSSKTTLLLGASLLVGSIFGQQKSPKDQQKESGRSNIFSRPQNTTSEGGRVPILLGRHLIGWTIVSAIVRNATHGKRPALVEVD